MSVSSASAAGQRMAVSLMLDTCLVTAPGAGARVLDPVTLKYTDPAPVTVYEGPCRLGKATTVGVGGVSQTSSAGESWDVLDSVLHLPMAGTDGVVSNCTVTYLSSAANPSLVGRVYGVLAVVEATNLTARRCHIREIVSD